MSFSTENIKYISRMPSLLSEVNNRISRLAERKISTLEAGMANRVIWELQNFNQLTIHRVVDLANGICESWEQGKPVNAFILTRACMENAAAVFDVATQVQRFISERKYYSLRLIIVKRLFGSKDENSYIIPPNILTAVDKTDTVYNGFRKTYDDLSEIVHPNFRGMYGLYASGIYDSEKIDDKSLKTRLDNKFGKHEWNFYTLLFPFSLALKAIEDSIDKIEIAYETVTKLADEAEGSIGDED